MAKITGTPFNMVYVDDLAKARAFYEKHFGFKVDSEFNGSVWGKSGDVALWIGGGYKRTDFTEKSTRTSITYGVDSAQAFFAQLKADGVPTVQAEPEDMGSGDFWFQAMDPAGNILEFLGPK